MNSFFKFRSSQAVLSAYFVTLFFMVGCGGSGSGNLTGYASAITAPVVTLDTYPVNISSANVATVSLAGTCAVEGGPIQVTAGSVTGSTLCSQGAWSSTLNLTALTEGNVTIAVSHTQPSSSEMRSASTILIKHTLAPSAASLVINNSWINTLSTSATLTLNASSASDMYVTPVLGCSSGGVWEAYAGSKPWTLSSLNADNTIYVKYRDSFGNETACVSSKIHHGIGTSFSDSFSGSALDSHWLGANLQSVSGGEVIFTPAANLTNTSQANLRMDFTEATLSVEVTQVLNNDPNTQTFLYVMDESFNALYIFVSNGNLNFIRGLAYNATTIPYNPVTHRFWRIRLASPNIYWETSPDAVTWTMQKTVAASTAVTSTSGYLYLIAKATAPVATPGNAHFDNLLIVK